MKTFNAAFFTLVSAVLSPIGVSSAEVKSLPAEESRLTVAETNETYRVIHAGTAIGVVSGNTICVYLFSGKSWALHGTYSGRSRESNFALREDGVIAVRDSLGNLEFLESIGDDQWADIDDPGIPGGEGQVSISMSGNRAAAGAFVEDSNMNRGVVRIYESGSWNADLEPAKVPDGANAARFGTALDLEGDRILIGAPGDAGGAAYVFEKTAKGWDRGQLLQVLGNPAGLGLEVSLHGDLAIVGSTDGSLYSFVSSARGWSYDSTVPLPRGTGTEVTFSHHGDQLAVCHQLPSGHLRTTIYQHNAPFARPGWTETTSWDSAWPVGELERGMVAMHDGQAVVGAYPVGGTVRGDKVAGLFADQGKTWKLQEVLGGTSAEFAGFGRVFAVDGNFMIVGDPEENNEDGTAILYLKEAGELGELRWRRVARVVANERFRGRKRRFGASVAIVDESASTLPGTTVSLRAKFVVGAPAENGHRGRAYLFVYENGVAELIDSLEAPSPSASDSFGSAVAYDPSGIYQPVVVGAPGDSVSGRVHIFRTRNFRHVEHLTTISAGNGFAFFGQTLAVDDGLIVVGAPNLNSAGDVYAFSQHGAGGGDYGLIQHIPGGGTFFGKSLALEGGILGVGAGGITSGEPVRLYRYDNQARRFDPVATLNPNTKGDAPIGFGSTLAIDNGRVAVLERGVFHLFDEYEPTPGGWGLQYSSANVGATGSVAYSDVHLMVGAPGDDTVAPEAGAIISYRAGSYECWAARQGERFFPLSAPDEDADRDGDTNFLEFCLGSDPLRASSRAPSVFTVESDGNESFWCYRVEVPRYSTLFTYYARQSTTDMVNWSTTYTTGGRYSGGVPRVIKWRQPITKDEPSRIFRFRATYGRSVYPYYR